MSSKEKSKFEMTKADKVCYDQEMKELWASSRRQEEGPKCSQRPLSEFFLFCSEFHPKIKPTNPGFSIGRVAKKLGVMWNNLGNSEKQPHITKAAKLREKDEKDVAGCKSKRDV